MMFLPRAPSPSRTTPPPVQPLECNLPPPPVLMLPSGHDSPPKDCLALTWPFVNEKVSPTSSQAIMPVGAVSSSGAPGLYQQSRAVVFDSPSGHRTVCLQNTLCYTLPPNSPKGSPFAPSVISGSPDKSKQGTGRLSSSTKHGDSYGGESPHKGRERKASPGVKMSMRSLTDGRGSPLNQTDGGNYGRPDSHTLRQRHLPKERTDPQLPREGTSRPGRSLGSSDPYQGILEQDHPHEITSRGFLASCACSLLRLIPLVLLIGLIVFWWFGTPKILISMFASSSVCPNVNITYVKGELQKGLIGQPAALNLIISALSSNMFQSRHNLIMFFHGSSGVGKTHTANIITESVLKGTERDSCIHLFSSDVFLLRQKEQSKEMFVHTIEDWVRGKENVEPNSCCVSFFIFDELQDDTPNDLTQALGQVLSGINTSFPSQLKKGTRVFIIMTMIGSQAISEFLITNMRRGHDRHSLTTQTSSWQEPWKHLTATLDKLDTFRNWLHPDNYVRIPFLPLEKFHIKQCARRRLECKNISPSEERLEWVSDQLTYFPDDWPVFSSSGCKKVAGKVDLVHKDEIPIFNFRKPF
ncbi:torsin-2A-like [Acanthaster planci]|uniref:Torsin-2A-like n=1 Tax=Acanthaster planci TaxID=133434 RepID=A0A8B7XW90_ACAPL|nr:torsin-2A-like [Acanthaster planci]